MDFALGKDIKHRKFSDKKEFVDAYNADVATWPAETKKAFAYYLQGEGRGRAETFADLFCLAYWRQIVPVPGTFAHTCRS